MLGRFEILIGIGGAMIATLIFYTVVKKRQKGRLPPGSIIIEGPEPDKRGTPPGTSWSRRAVAIGLGFSSFFTIFALIASIFNLWLFIPALFIIDLPLCVNWGGMVVFWIQYVWGLLVALYNVNYTPLTLGMKGKYVMASGGPYRYIRHPMYVGKVIQTICIFFVTGLWPALFAAPFWGALPKQAANEETAMRETFGRQYEEYCQRTGRFFPKFHRLKP